MHFLASEQLPTTAPTEAEVTSEALTAKIIESYTFVQENTQGFRQLIINIRPFLPADEHHHLEISCAYLLRKCNEFLAHPDPVSTDYDDNLDALATLYCHLQRNFEECFERARTQAESDKDTKTT